MDNWGQGYNHHDNTENQYGSTTDHESRDNDNVIDDLFNEVEGTDTTEGDDTISDNDSHMENSDVEDDSTISNFGDSEDVTAAIESIVDDFVSVPNNASSDSKFSEKDTYRIINVMTVLNTLSDDIKKWLDTILNIGGADVKRSMTIVSNGLSELETKTSPIWVLSMVSNAVEEKDPVKVMTDIIGAIKVIGDMEEEDRVSFINFSRKVARDNSGEKKINIKVTRNSTDAEIVEELRNMFVKNPEVSRSVSGFTAVVDVIKKALH